MKINEQVLSIEQMKHLQELGVDTSDASMCWLKYTGTDGVVRYLINANDISCHVMPFMEAFPTYSIGDLIEKLPKSTDFGDLLIEFCNSDLGYGDWDCSELYGIEARQNFKDKPLKNALYDLLCWVAENHKEVLNKNNK